MLGRPHLRLVSSQDDKELALRTSLAVVRGMGLIDKLSKEASSTVEHHEAKRFDYLETLLNRIHRELYHDWGMHEPGIGAPGTIGDPEKRIKIRNALRSFVENGQETGRLFDANGIFVHHSKTEMAGILANFYQKMRDIKPFDYGSEMTLDFFVTAIGQLPGFQAVCPGGIDLRRLKKGDAEGLHTGDIQAIRTAFNHALDPEITPELANQPTNDNFREWPKNATYIAGIPFLTHEVQHDNRKVTCLVTVNGGLVPLDNVKERMTQHFLEDKLISDLPPITKDQLIQPDDLKDKIVEQARQLATEKDIDGFRIGEHGEAPLVCLDVNLLTGLRPATHDQFKDFLEQVAGKGTPVTSLHKNPNLLYKLEVAAQDDPRMSNIIRVANEHINIMVDKLDTEKKKILDQVPPTAHPHMLMSMGGAGAGKTAAEDMAKKVCDGNFVTASLDQFRERSDLYKVLKAADHHADDYTLIEPFANSLRDWVTDGAREQGKNLFFDGTGIAYQPRYAKIVESFKQAGYDTQAIGVDTMLAIPAGRNKDFGVPAAQRVSGRFDSDRRALPWLVVTGKHAKMPESTLQALEHSALDKLAVFSNDGGPGGHYLVAESFTMTRDEVAALQQAKQEDTLADYMKTHLIKDREDSATKRLDGYADKQGNTYSAADIQKRNAKFTEDNVTFLAYPHGENVKVMAVYDEQRFIDLMQKAQMNAQAASPKLLYENAAPAQMRFAA